MKTILILGAHGATAQIVTNRLLKETADQLKLYLRNPQRLKQFADNPRVELIDGNTESVAALTQAMQNVDLVYSNVGGVNLAKSTQAILTAMTQAGVKRLIFFSALGARHEVPGKFGAWNEQAIADYLPGFRKSAELLDAAANIDTTEIRPAWLTDYNEIDYELTGSHDAFKGTEVSRQSVADLIVKIIKDPRLYENDSIGIDKPNTDGAQPAWI
ncbi:oxidoreductase [Lactobacillus selangorensis]|uniref:Oxidoreductase n=1 Tax=Lactobacillus selangorensis TaxID=81857 RepID=A0A0R2G0P7_9LACO|nr:NAD(P)H-binding protein [Lactobacillus selangorensis]KRN28121.1 oxidoreductase [Lactobacillus selangorensis]KRN31002.1 oxidoreductase [Lactobacillus selangorensis]